MARTITKVARRGRLDVVAVGGALVDFLPVERGLPVHQVHTWYPRLGGSAATVVVGVSRLGGRSALVGVTGQDEFGHFLIDSLHGEGVDVSCFRQTERGKTGLGFVSLSRSGERSFLFYRQGAAETFLERADLEAARPLFESTAVIHVGTNSLIKARPRRAALRELQRARSRGVITSTDPNIRLKVWRSPEQLGALVTDLIERCEVVKLSREEVKFVTGEADPRRALAWLERKGVTLGVVTLGRSGAVFRFRGSTRRISAPQVSVVDTTGAGDGFMAGLLFALTRSVRTRDALSAAPAELVADAVLLGCEVGSHVVTHLGAVSGLPRGLLHGGSLRRVR